MRLSTTLSPNIPNKPYRFELISERHDVSAFECRTALLNDFLLTKALAETQQDTSRTFLLLDAQDTVVGYITLRSDALNYQSSVTNRYVSTPVVELSYLARHINQRGQGLGDILLIRALRHVAESAEWIGIAGVSLAYTREGKPLYERFGFGEHPYGEWLLFLPISKVRAIVSELRLCDRDVETSNVNLDSVEEEDTSDLQAASESSLSFWDNSTDDAAWNDA